MTKNLLLSLFGKKIIICIFLQITLTLWGTEAENFDGTNNPVVVIKGAKVGEFGGGKNLSCLASSLLKMNPDIPESFRIRGWYDQEGHKGNVVDISAKQLFRHYI